MKRLVILLSLLIVVSLVITACAPGLAPTPAAAGEIKLTILHTNDTHGHLDAFRIAEFPDPVGGVARRATLVAQIRQETPNVLLVDGGDVHQGILMADTFKGEPDIQFMNTLGYDVMGLGNHDLDWGWATLQARQSAARFPIVNANLVISDTGKPALTPYVIKEVAGLKIAFTSLAGPDFRTLVKPENISGLRFADPIATAQALVPELRQQADLVVVLGHEMVNDDQALAAAVPGIDVIIGGHEHIRLNEAVRVGDTVLVEAWQFGAFVGRLDLTVRGGQVVAANYRLIPVANSIAPDPAIAAEVQLLVVQLKEQKPERFAVLGEALVDITDTNVRRQEAAIGNFATDVMRAAAQADVALSTSSSFLNSIFKGPITVNDLTEAMPYQNSLVTVRLTGAQVQQVLTVSAQNIGKGNFCQVSGVRFTIAGDQVTDIQVGGAPLDAARLYLVATTNYQGGIAAGYKDIFAAGQGYTDTGQDVGQLIVDYIQSHQQVGARVEGRITVQ